jgi:hypothetical protein
MIVGEIKNQIDGIWNDFWSGGLSNPLSVMEQITQGCSVLDTLEAGSRFPRA